MKHIRVVLALCVGVATGAAGLMAAADSPAHDSIIPFPVHQKTLANGLKVIVLPMKSNGLIGYRMAIRTGARDEYEPGRTGFAHFFEHMMFRGTETYSQDAYNEFITQIGADTNAYTSDDVTVYLLNIAAEDLDKVMEVESDRFKNLSYPLQSFKTEAGAVYGEYRKNRTSPWFTIYEATRKAAFERHTYGHTAMGYEEDIKQMPEMFDYSRSFFERYYRPDNAILLVAGDIAPDDVFAKAQKYYGDWKSGYVAPKVTPEPEQTAERRIDVAYDGRSLPMAMIAYKGDAITPTDRTYVASIVLAELAFGETSEFYRRMVLDEQIVQSIDADPAMSRDPGLWTVITMIKEPAHIDRVLTEIDATIARYRDTLVDDQRLADVKSNMRYSFVMGLDSPSRVAGRLAHLTGVAGKIEAIDDMYKTLNQVTPDDVKAAATKYLTNQRRTVAVLKGKE